jgi:hypothetical protein
VVVCVRCVCALRACAVSPGRESDDLTNFQWILCSRRPHAPTWADVPWQLSRRTSNCLTPAGRVRVGVWARVCLAALAHIGCCPPVPLPLPPHPPSPRRAPQLLWFDAEEKGYKNLGPGAVFLVSRPPAGDGTPARHRVVVTLETPGKVRQRVVQNGVLGGGQSVKAAGGKVTVRLLGAKAGQKDVKLHQWVLAFGKAGRDAEADAFAAALQARV